MKLPLKIGLCIIVCLGLGFLSGYYSGSGATIWYQTLNKPFFQPPPWLFGPVWTVLYIMMGIAVALVWDKEGISPQLKSKALLIFIFQLVLNLTWSPLFFGLQQMVAALCNIVLLIILIVLTIHYFKRIDKLAAHLIKPYLIWVCFATLLNASLINLN